MACRPVEHPRRNFQPTVCLRLFQRAAEDDLASLVDGTMNANSATKPSMMPIKNLAKNGPVGVLKPRCTTAHQNTHLSMLLKKRDFADRDAIPRGISGSVALVRR